MQSYSSFINSINGKLVYRKDHFKILPSISSNPSNAVKYLESLNLSKDVQKVVLKMVDSNPSVFLMPYNMKNLRKSNLRTMQIVKFHSKSMDQEPESKNYKSSTKNDKSKTIVGDSFETLLKKYSHDHEFQKSLMESYKLATKSALSAKKSNKLYDYKWLILGICGLLLIYYFFNSIKIKPGLSNLFLQMNAVIVENIDVRFRDVQGCDEVKKELKDVVEFLKNPTVFNDIGARLPKGVLMVGEPGVGKTLLAKAIAGEAGVPFFSASGSDFDEMFVGSGAARIRSLFENARKHAPCVIFIDELDSICGQRTTSTMHPYANQTINQILAEMDGFHLTEGIIVIGATNRFEHLDKAAIRPGRFDMHIRVHKPDYMGRMALFQLYLSRISNVDEDNIDIASLARSCIGYTGADINNLINQAAILCVLKGDPSLRMSHIWDADTKIQLGAVRSKPIDSNANRLTAYHEAGHALVAFFSPNSVFKLKTITILPRGSSGGHTGFIPKREMYYLSKLELESQIDGLLGGRAAEELIGGFDGITTGVESDISEATKLVRNMVQRLSMSDEVGLQVFNEDNLSPTASNLIDKEVGRILGDSYERAKLLIQEHSKEWHQLSEYLLKYETLSGEDIELILRGDKPKVALEQLSSSNKINISESVGKLPFVDSVKGVVDYFANSNK